MIDPITVDNFAALFNCTPVDRASDSIMTPTFFLVGWDRSSFVCCLVHRGSTDDLLLLQIGVVLAVKGSPAVTQYVVCVESLSLLLHSI